MTPTPRRRSSRAGPQGVAAVVARSDEQRDAPTRRGRRASAARRRRARTRRGASAHPAGPAPSTTCSAARTCSTVKTSRTRRTLARIGRSPRRRVRCLVDLDVELDVRALHARHGHGHAVGVGAGLEACTAATPRPSREVRAADLVDLLAVRRELVEDALGDVLAVDGRRAGGRGDVGRPAAECRSRGRAVGLPPTRSMSKLIVSPSTEVTVTLTSNGVAALRRLADDRLARPRPCRSVGQSAVSVPSWLLICSSTLSFVATLPHAVSATTSREHQRADRRGPTRSADPDHVSPACSME